MAASKKPRFPAPPILNIFFMKFSWIGPWVSRINWCKEHWDGSTYMVVRLSERCSLLYEVSFSSALWMAFPASWKRSCPNFYAHDCRLTQNFSTTVPSSNICHFLKSRFYLTRIFFSRRQTLRNFKDQPFLTFHVCL